MRITYDFGLVGEVSFGTSVPVFGTLAKPAIAVPCFDGLERGIVLPWGSYSLFCDVGAASVYALEYGVSIAGMVFVSCDWAMFVSDFRDSVLGVRGFSEGRATRPWRRRDVICAAQFAFDSGVGFHEARCARFAIAFLCNLSMCFAPVSMKDVSSDVGVLDRHVPVLESFMKHRYDLALSACVVGEDAASELSRYLSFGYALFVCFDADALVPDADGELFSLGGRHAAIVVKVQDSVVFCDQHGSRVLSDDCVMAVLGGVSKEHVVVGVRRQDAMDVREFASLVLGGCHMLLVSVRKLCGDGDFDRERVTERLCDVLRTAHDISAGTYEGGIPDWFDTALLEDMFKIDFEHVTLSLVQDTEGELFVLVR